MKINQATALGTDDSVTTCDCCGKSNLKFTVAIQLADGEVVHYGSVCARRNTGKDQRTITSEIKAHEADQRAAAQAAYRAHPAYLAERARFAERDRLPFGDARRMGMAAAEFVREWVAAAHAARNEIAVRFNVNAWSIA
jgi:hypothetical protein